MKYSLITTTIALAAVSSLQAVTLATSSTAPTDNIIASNTITGSFTRAFSDGVNSSTFNSTRGSSFLTTGTVADTYDVTSISILKNGTQNFNADAALSIWVFEYVAGGGNPGWNAGDGHGDGDPLSGTNLTTFVSGETVSIANQTINNDDYITFNFDSSFSVNGGSQYGFLIGFAGGDTNDNTYFQIERGDGYADGQIINTSDTNNSTLGQDMTFYVTAIPEPSAALLGILGSFIFLRRRR